MAFNLKQALEFNKVTMALAAAGFAFVSKAAADLPDFELRLVGLGAALAFALSTVWGLLVVGRASKIAETATDDATIRAHGKAHTGLLFAGLLLASILVFTAIWRGPPAKTAPQGAAASTVVQ